MLFNQIINILHKSNNGTLWIGTNKGLYYYDINVDSIKPVESKYSLGIENPYSITSIENGLDSVLWIGTKQGLIQIGGGSEEGINYFKNKKNENSIVSNKINDIEWDNLRGELWISTVDGISKYSPVQNSFSNIPTKPYCIEHYKKAYNVDEKYLDKLLDFLHEKN